MPKVYATQHVRHLDLAQLAQFGDLEYLTMEEIYPNEDDANKRIINNIRRNLQEYTPGEDFILLTGSAVPNLIAGQFLVPGTHKILKWSSRDHYYRTYRITL